MVHFMLSAKEDTGKFMKNALYILRYAPKGTSQAKAMSNSEKIKPVALAVIVILVWNHQAVRYCIVMYCILLCSTQKRVNTDNRTYIISVN